MSKIAEQPRRVWATDNARLGSALCSTEELFRSFDPAPAGKSGRRLVWIALLVVLLGVMAWVGGSRLQGQAPGPAAAGAAPHHAGEIASSRTANPR